MLQEQINAVMPGWTVVCKLGEGSYGGVYQIVRTLPDGSQEQAALKKLSVPRDNEEIRVLEAQSVSRERIAAYFKGQVKSLVNEYLYMQQLSTCPNVVSCQDIQYCPREGGIGWNVYIRMEFLTPLKKMVAGKYNEYQVLQLGMDMCCALMACERRSIIHRDIKPENILVSSNGSYKLADFGIAKISEKTQSGTLAGTNGYMAPEVANRQHYGKEVDIYSLGMVLYWMMNENTLPFLPLLPAIPTAEQRENAIAQRLNGVPLPPPVNGSPWLKRVVLRACAFNPAERYRSAAEFGAVLQHIQKNKKATSTDEILQELGLTEDILNADLSQEHDEKYKNSAAESKENVPEGKTEKPGKKRTVFPGLLLIFVLIAVIGGGFFLGRFHNARSVQPVAAEIQVEEQTQLPTETILPTEASQYDASFNGNGVVITKWHDLPMEEVWIPEEIDGQPVIEIGAGAFASCIAPKRIFLPNSISKIDAGAFEDCKRLESIQLPQNLELLGANAFRGCSALREVQLPGTLTAVKNQTFQGCTKLESIEIPQSVYSVEEQAFSGCSGLTMVELPDKLEKIGEKAFQNCGELVGIDIPETVREIGEGAFYGSGLLQATLHVQFEEIKDNFLPQDCDVTYVGYEKINITGEVGDTFTFGRYEQDNNLDNGPEPIEWKILERDGTKVFVISLYGLDSQRYHDKWEIVTWETCCLRQWLNQTFYSAAFNPAEQTMILTSDVYSESPAHTYPSRMVQDKIFLLDYKGAYQYFKSEKARTCYATNYAVSAGSAAQGKSHYCWWWLREGYFVDLASIPNAQRANFTDYGGTVRPVMWIETAN